MFPKADLSGFAADAATPAGAASLIAAAEDVDILVNNLGTARPKPFAEITDEDWLDLFQFNVMSGIRMTRHHLPRMVGRGWGRGIGQGLLHGWGGSAGVHAAPRRVFTV